MIKLLKQIPIYPRKLLVVVAKDFNEAGKPWNITFSEEDMQAKALAFRCNTGRNKTVAIFIHPEHINSWGVWAHESLHVINYIFDDIGIPADNNNDEAHAYLITWVMDTVQAFLTKEEKKLKE